MILRTITECDVRRGDQLLTQRIVRPHTKAEPQTKIQMERSVHREIQNTWRDNEVAQRIVEGMIDDHINRRACGLGHLSDSVAVAVELAGVILHSDACADHERRCEGDLQKCPEAEFQDVAVLEIADAAGGILVEGFIRSAVNIELGSAVYAKAYNLAESRCVVLCRCVPAEQQEEEEKRQSS